MYKFTIFFSWQSDLPDNRKIIRDAIKATCQKLKEDNGWSDEFVLEQIQKSYRIRRST